LNALDILIERSFITYKSRLLASQRLTSLDKAWNFSLISLSSALVIASIGLLVNPKMYGSQGAVLLVSISVFSLSVSLVITSQNYGIRSRDMFANYRRIQRISVAAESLKLRNKYSWIEVQNLSLEYQSLLDESENHSSTDFKKAKKSSTTDDKPKKLIQKIYENTLQKFFMSSVANWVPYIFLLVPAGLLIPFINWILSVN